MHYNSDIDSNNTGADMSEVKLAARFQRIVDGEVAKIAKFQDELIKDPAYALSWSNGAFQSAARLRVAKMMADAFTDGWTVQDARDTLMDRVMHKSKYPAQSTSPTSNLIEQYELAAYAEFLGDLKHL
jgi:hypothetical protein